MTEPAWIDVTDERDAGPELAAAYAQFADPATGKIDHILKIHSLNPQTLFDHYALYRTLMFGRGPLRRPQREMIAVVVSAINGCHY